MKDVAAVRFADKAQTELCPKSSERARGRRRSSLTQSDIEKATKAVCNATGRLPSRIHANYQEGIIKYEFGTDSVVEVNPWHK